MQAYAGMPSLATGEPMSDLRLRIMKLRATALSLKDPAARDALLAVASGWMPDSISSRRAPNDALKAQLEGTCMSPPEALDPLWNASAEIVTVETLISARRTYCDRNPKGFDRIPHLSHERGVSNEPSSSRFGHPVAGDQVAHTGDGLRAHQAMFPSGPGQDSR